MNIECDEKVKIKKTNIELLKNSKDIFFQAVRGILIICVVFIHTLTENENLTFNNELNIIIRTIINFAVGIFIFLSGYFIKLDDVKTSPFNFYKKKFKRILIPYIIWSFLYTCFQHIEYIKEINIIAIICSTIFGNNGAQLYYIIALTQLVILTPIFVYIFKKNKKILNLLLLSITPIYTFINGLFNYYFGKNIPLYATLFIAWISFYYLGILFRNTNLKKGNKFWTIILSIIILIINIIINLYEYKYISLPYSYCTSQVKLSNTIYTIIVIFSIFTLYNKYNNIVGTNILKTVGDYSFGIYFIHIFFIIVFKKILINVESFYIIKPIIITVLSVIGSIIFIKIFNKLTKNKLKKYVGF